MVGHVVAAVLLILAVGLMVKPWLETRPARKWRMALLRVGAGVTVKNLWYVTLILLLFTASVSIYYVRVMPAHQDAPVSAPQAADLPEDGRIATEQTDRDFLDAVYRALTLLSFGADWTLPAPSAEAAAQPPALEWPIQLLRFLVPAWIVLAGGWLLAFESVGSWFQRLVMPRRKHTVVFGLGEAGTTFVSAWIRAADGTGSGSGAGRWNAWKTGLRQFIEHGPIIAVERDPEAAGVAVCRAHGIPVVTGDPLGVGGEAVLRRAGVRYARTVIGLLPDDVPNIELALRVQAYTRGREREMDTPLVFVAQVNDVNLSRRLNSYEKITHLTNTDLRFQNIYRLMAEQLLLWYPPDFYADLFERSAPHLAIYGFGELGQQVLTQCFRLCHAGAPAPTEITIYDRHHERAETLLETEYPGLSDTDPGSAFTVRIKALDLSVPAPPNSLICDVKGKPVTQHIVCFPDEKFALSFSLALRDALMEHRGLNAPIFVRTRRAHGLAALLESNTGEPEIPDGLFPFGMLERVIRPEILNNTYLDTLAEAIHQVSYVPFHNTGDWARRPWRHLDDHSRRSNRFSALHLDTKLRAVDLRRAPVRTVSTMPVAWHQALDRLARLEHRRWVGAHLADGWRYGPVRSNMLRIHDAMCDYDALDAPFQGNDRRNVELLPGILAGDIEHCAAVVGAWSAKVGMSQPGPLDTQALKVLKADPQALFPVRRIGIVSNEPTADAAEATLDLAAFARALDQVLRATGLGGLDDLKEHHAATIVSPLLHPLERAAAQWLLETHLAPEPLPAAQAPPEEIARPPRHQILALLPVPFDVLAGEENVGSSTIHVETKTSMGAAIR